MKNLTIATRGSKLALWQAGHIKDRLETQHGISVELLVLKTKGDIILDVPLSKVGGKGLFVKEIEEALLDGRADLAVHSMKDVPMELPAGLILTAVPEREDSADLLLSVKYKDVDALPKGALVGTSSLRRQAQLLAMRPDLRVESLRGNVDTRLRKLMDGDYDAIIMAAAGMNRLGFTAPFMYRMCAPAFLPASGQGALGIECREDRTDVREMLEFLNHAATFCCVEAERGYLCGLEGGCQVPIAAQATLSETHPEGAVPKGATLTLEGLVACVDGSTVIRRTITGKPENARVLGIALAEEILQAGGAEILAELYCAAE